MKVGENEFPIPQERGKSLEAPEDYRKDYITTSIIEYEYLWRNDRKIAQGEKKTEDKGQEFETIISNK